jgi:hypothetical protein
MLTLTPHVKIYVHLSPTVMRKSFDGLTGLARSVLQADPRDGGNDHGREKVWTGKGVRTRFWCFPLLGTATARRPVCLWPASRVALSGCTSGAAGQGRGACGVEAKREPRVAAGAATRGYGRVPLQGTCAWGVASPPAS